MTCRFVRAIFCEHFFRESLLFILLPLLIIVN